MMPGRLLHRIAVATCSPRTLARVVEPAIADLQAEWQRAHGGRSWRRIKVSIAGYIAVLKVIAVCAMTPGRSVEERAAFKRMLCWTVAVAVVAVVPLMLAPLAGFPESTLKRALLIHLIPQALPLALPAGLTFGVAFGLAGMTRSRQNARDVLLLALGIAAVSLGVIGSWMPAANQAFRQAIFAERGGSGMVRKGLAEMGVSELRREAASLEAGGNVARARELRWTLHVRFALPAAALALPAFLFVISERRIFARGLVALIACLGYFALVIAGGAAAVRGSPLGPAFAAWLPNLVFVAAALAVIAARPREKSTAMPA